VENVKGRQHVFSRRLVLLRLKFLRMSRGLRQEQIAALCRIPRPHVSQIENGVRNPNPRELAALARVFHCPPEHLLDRISEPSLNPGAESGEVRS
jgi:transcriptional regulator with XRE-family HTH domain